MRHNLKEVLRLAHLNLGGLSIQDKIVVIESDDWGSLRSNRSFLEDKYFKENKKIKDSAYLRYDCLENENDLQEIFKVLNSFRDEYGNTPVITANTIVTNPDFEKIRESNFQKYYSQSFRDTLFNRDKDESVFNLYKEGYSKNLFVPQFHGNEHLNIAMWLKLLQTDEMFRRAFDHKVWGLSSDVRPDLGKSVQAALDTNCFKARESLAEGLKNFHTIFGYFSDTFIANNYIWDACVEDVLRDNNVSYIQGMKYQLLPLDEFGFRKAVRHRFGEVNGFNQIYGVRNCSLEVAEHKSTVNSCLNEVEYAFKFRKPAIISMHRVNFMGGIEISNRERGLTTLYEFLAKLLLKWPNVKFLSTVELNKVLRNGHIY